MNPIKEQTERFEIDPETPLKILIPCTLFMLAIDFITFLFIVYDMCLPRWPVVHDFSEVFYHLKSARYSIRRHLLKVDLKKKE